ncbi:phage tail spike protein [Listeria booriae]|uniref:phage tail spike protein n=1 Tax=Listeria booriae TaxID=1552123 RepID=UPI00162621BB|nr:phage tail spike protein [Listeria booriae]MBC2149487.1 hypothetical protein [Listeria booriae]
MYTVKFKQYQTDENWLTIHATGNKSTYQISEGTLTLGLNSIDGFEFRVTQSNVAFNRIFALKSLIEVFDERDNSKVFSGRVLKTVRRMREDGLYEMAVTCESRLGYLLDSQQRVTEFHSITVKQYLQKLLEAHNKQVEPYKQFLVGNVTVVDSNDSLYRYSAYSSTLENIREDLLEPLGGYLQVREHSTGMLYLDYIAVLDDYSTTEIRQGVNVKTVSYELDPLNVITRVIPLGAQIESNDPEATDASKQRVNISSVNDGLDYLDAQTLQGRFGIIGGCVIFDDVTSPTTLKKKGQDYINANQSLGRQSYQVDTLDLSYIDKNFKGFKVGHFYNFVTAGLTSVAFIQITELKIDINNPHKPVISFGDKTKTLTGTQSKFNKIATQISGMREASSNQSQNIIALQSQVQAQNEKIALLQADLDNIKNTYATGAYVQQIKADLEMGIEANRDEQLAVNATVEARLLALEGGAGNG